MMNGWTRRGVIAAAGVGGAAIGGGAVQAHPKTDTSAAYPKFRILPRARVIIDNDFGGDPDGLVAAAHQLLSPTTVVKALTTTGNLISGIAEFAKFPVWDAKDRAAHLLATLGMENGPPVYRGATAPLSDLSVPQHNDAALAIVKEAMAGDEKLPLFVTCGGPLTNVASALLIEPRIAERMTLVWIGGGTYPVGGQEYNLWCDVKAAQVVFNHSKVPVWQIPYNVYRTCLYSAAELEANLRPLGPTGAWLWQCFAEIASRLDVGGLWALGDSPLVLVTALDSKMADSGLSPFVNRAVPIIRDDMSYGESGQQRTIRLYTAVDFRLIVGDFLARLQLHNGNGQNGPL